MGRQFVAASGLRIRLVREPRQAVKRDRCQGLSKEAEGSRRICPRSRSDPDEKLKGCGTLLSVFCSAQSRSGTYCFGHLQAIPRSRSTIMSLDSAIEWTDATWNPVRGCTKISPGCKHCYAETFAERFRGVKGHPYEQGFDMRLVPGKLAEPLHWRTPKTIFVNSMSDLFHDQI